MRRSLKAITAVIPAVLCSATQYLSLDEAITSFVPKSFKLLRYDYIANAWAASGGSLCRLCHYTKRVRRDQPLRLKSNEHKRLKRHCRITRGNLPSKVAGRGRHVEYSSRWLDIKIGQSTHRSDNALHALRPTWATFASFICTSLHTTETWPFRSSRVRPVAKTISRSTLDNTAAPTSEETLS